MKNNFLHPTKSLVIIILLSILLVGISFNLWTTKAVIVSFNADATKDLTYQVFYTTKPKLDFNEVNSVKYKVEAGKKHVKIVIFTHKIARFRLDFGSTPEKLIISDLVLNGRQKLKFDDFNKFNFLNIDNKQIEPNKLTINTNHRDPYIVYRDKLLLTAQILVDWHRFIILATFYFFVSWKLVKYLVRFKVEKNHSRIDIVFLSVFFVLLFIPMGYISDAQKSEQENRTLAIKPSLSRLYENAYNYGSKFEQWYNDRFFGRNVLLDVHGDFMSYLKTHGNDRVLVGKNGWLFYKVDNSIRNFQNLDLLSDDELQKVVKYLSDINNWAKANNKDFYYIICPDKNKVYGEYIRYINKLNSDSQSRANQLINYLRKYTDVKVVYPYKALHDAKKQGLLYWKNDTHWNKFGAYIGYVELMAEITKNRDVHIVKYNGFNSSKHLKGDLTNMTKKRKEDKTSYMDPSVLNNAKCDKDTNQREDVTCINQKLTTNLYIYRDSFATSLSPYLNNTFGNVKYFWRYNITKEDLVNIKNNADIIVLEQVERYIPRLANFTFPKD